MPEKVLPYKVPENFAHLANAMPQLVWIAEPDGEVNLIMVNKAFAEMLNYTPEELCQLNLTEITYPYDRPIHHDRFNALVNNAQKLIYENRYLQKDNSVVCKKLTSFNSDA